MPGWGGRASHAELADRGRHPCAPRSPGRRPACSAEPRQGGATAGTCCCRGRAAPGTSPVWVPWGLHLLEAGVHVVHHGLHLAPLLPVKAWGKGPGRRGERARWRRAGTRAQGANARERLLTACVCTGVWVRHRLMKGPAAGATCLLAARPCPARTAHRDLNPLHPQRTTPPHPSSRTAPARPPTGHDRHGVCVARRLERLGADAVLAQRLVKHQLACVWCEGVGGMSRCLSRLGLHRQAGLLRAAARLGKNQ